MYSSEQEGNINEVNAKFGLFNRCELSKGNYFLQSKFAPAFCGLSADYDMVNAVVCIYLPYYDDFAPKSVYFSEVG